MKKKNHASPRQMKPKCTNVVSYDKGKLEVGDFLNSPQCLIQTTFCKPQKDSKSGPPLFLEIFGVPVGLWPGTSSWAIFRPTLCNDGPHHFSRHIYLLDDIQILLQASLVTISFTSPRKLRQILVM